MKSYYFRDYLKRVTPGTVLRTARAVRGLIEPRPIETVVLGDYSFVADTDDGLRINLVIPALDPASAFGGAVTAIEFVLKLQMQLRRAGPVSVRFLSESDSRLEETVIPRVAIAAGLTLKDVAIAAAPRGAAIPTRRRDIFIVYNWWTSLNTQPLINKQSMHFNMSANPKFYFFQDYEPHFYPFSSAHLLAIQAINNKYPLTMIINTNELHNYYIRNGNKSDKNHIFEPILNSNLIKYIDNIKEAEKKKTILVYARPNIARNCYTLLIEALKIWANDRTSDNWRVVSAGATHQPVLLRKGKALTPLGKLSLEDYGAVLRETGVGVSLMASPHPSYPPLEMAHFGARVITNGFVDKDLSRRHDNIRSMTDIRPGAIAAALKEECIAFEQDPGAGLRARSRMPEFLGGEFECLGQVAEEILSLSASCDQSCDAGRASPAGAAI